MQYAYTNYSAILLYTHIFSNKYPLHLIYFILSFHDVYSWFHLMNGINKNLKNFLKLNSLNIFKLFNLKIQYFLLKSYNRKFLLNSNRIWFNSTPALTNVFIKKNYFWRFILKKKKMKMKKQVFKRVKSYFYPKFFPFYFKLGFQTWHFLTGGLISPYLWEFSNLQNSKEIPFSVNSKFIENRVPSYHSKYYLNYFYYFSTQLRYFDSSKIFSTQSLNTDLELSDLRLLSSKPYTFLYNTNLLKSTFEFNNSLTLELFKQYVTLFRNLKSDTLRNKQIKAFDLFFSKLISSTTLLSGKSKTYFLPIRLKSKNYLKKKKIILKNSLFLWDDLKWNLYD